MSKKLFKSVSAFSLMTILSRITGFVRDIVFATIFGTSAIFDAFIVAYRIPNLCKNIFGEGAFSQAFVPVLAQYSEQKGESATKNLIDHVAGTVALILSILIIVLELLAPFMVIVFAPGFAKNSEIVALTTSLIRVMLPYVLFLSLTAFMGAILNTFNRFLIPAFTPVLLNLSMMVATAGFAYYFYPSIMAVAWGVFFAGILQILIQIPSLKRLKLIPRVRIGFKDPGVRRVLKLMIPALFGVSVTQLSLIVDNIFASFLSTGSISWLYYSNRLTYLPLGVAGVAIATVILPHLSRHHAKLSFEKFSATMDWAVRCIITIAIPAMIGLIMLATPILATLFYHGKFSVRDVSMTAKSLIAFSAGLPAFMLIKIFAASFYSKQNVKTPVKIAALAMVMNITLNCLLIFPLKHVGLALSTSLSASLNAFLLLYLILKKRVYQPQKGWWKLCLKILVASIAMAAFLYLFTPSTQTWFQLSTINSIFKLAILITVSLLLYLSVLLLLKVRPTDFKVEE